MIENIPEVTLEDLKDAERIDIFVDVGGSILHLDESKKAKSPLHGALRVSKKLHPGFHQLTSEAEHKLALDKRSFLKNEDLRMMLPKIDERTFIGNTNKPESITNEVLDRALELARLRAHTLFIYVLKSVGERGQTLDLFRKTRSTVAEDDLSSPTSDQ